MKKKILLVVILVLVAGSIWYLESIKAHPDAGGNGAPQAINVGDGTTAIATTTTTTIDVQGSNSPAAVRQSLATLAATDKAEGYEPAIEIADPTGFVNVSSSFKLGSLIGKKVILLDFWTYSCINCIRTLPYLTAWYSRYASSGLEIVGIHTPEFDFEKDINNVIAATQKYGIKYPVVLDSNYGTWNAYGNQYWPHEYLIDLAGYIVHDQVGEGNYDETEKKIQELLAERGQILGVQTAPTPSSTVTVASSTIAGGAISPETYFGANRNEYLANGVQGRPGTQTFSIPASLYANALYLKGVWDVEPEFAQTPEGVSASAPDSVEYQYIAKGIYWVAGSANGSPIDVEVLRDGKPVAQSVAGSDIFYKNGHSYIEVTGDRLYRLVDDKAAGGHAIELIITSPGLQAYTFTFG